MSNSQHDTIAYRLSQILIKLNQGDHLDPAGLAEEFGTHVRTIQRDLKVRMAYLPLLKTRGRYHLEPAYLGKLNFKDIERFAKLAGVQGLFPSLGTDFLKEALGGPPRHNSCRLLRNQEHGVGDEGNQWHVTDNHSRTGQ